MVDEEFPMNDVAITAALGSRVRKFGGSIAKVTAADLE